MASNYLQALNADNNCEANFITSTKDGNKNTLDVTICNPEEISGGDSCINRLSHFDVTATADTFSNVSVTLEQTEKLYVTITNTSEFTPVFYSQNAQIVLAGGGIILPCSSIDLCLNTTTRATLHFYTEANEARVIVTQGET